MVKACWFVLRGPNVRQVGIALGRYAKKRNKLLVRFPGLEFPRDFKAIDVANLRPATAAEIARMET